MNVMPVSELIDKVTETFDNTAGKYYLGVDKQRGSALISKKISESADEKSKMPEFPERDAKRWEHPVGKRLKTTSERP